jgi:hypothetical protein
LLSRLLSAAVERSVFVTALVRQRPLRHGNQQVALAAMLQFLALNGQDIDPDPPGPVAAMVTRVAAGTFDIKDVADWLAPRLRPVGLAAIRVKEASRRGRPALPLAQRIMRATIRNRPKGMFQRFTDRARRVVVLAQQEARGLEERTRTLREPVPNLSPARTCTCRCEP